MQNRKEELFRPITSEHVLEACEIVDRDGVPPRRKSRDTFLIVGGVEYPAKYVLGLAYELATGNTVAPNEYTGGEPTAIEFYERGFEVWYKGAPYSPAEDATPSRGPTPKRTESPIRNKPVEFESRLTDASTSDPVIKKSAPSETRKRSKKESARIARLVVDASARATPTSPARCWKRPPSAWNPPSTSL